MQKWILVLFLNALFSSFAIGQRSLDEYLQSAIKNSPVFIDNLNQINALRFDSLLMRANLKPQVNFTSNDFFAPTINGFGYDQIITNGGNYNAIVGVNYGLVKKNNLNNKFSSLNIQKQILDLNIKLTERDLKQAVSNQYITVYGEQQALNNVNKVLSILHEEENVLKIMAEKGIYHQTDFLSFSITNKQQQLAYSQQKLQAQSDLYLLNYLSGILDTTYINLPEPGIHLTQNISSYQSIQFRQFAFDSLKLVNTTEQLKLNYQPKINLLGDAGYNSSLIYQAGKNFGASVGLNLTVPIYDGNQRKLQIEKIQLSENTRTCYADFYKKQFSIKQKQLLQQIYDTDKLILQANEQLTMTEKLLNVNIKLLETGDTHIADYILSFANYISSQLILQQLNTSKLQFINQYNYLNY